MSHGRGFHFREMCCGWWAEWVFRGWVLCLLGEGRGEREGVYVVGGFWFAAAFERWGGGVAAVVGCGNGWVSIDAWNWRV